MIHLESISDPWFTYNHTVFDAEESCHNFDMSASGKIWIKWAADKIHFTLTFISSQTISERVTFGASKTFFLNVVYGSNTAEERSLLWQQIGANAPSTDVTWIIIGDLNCCKY